MHKVIIDCYTDEPSGLGVPPYLGTYARYLYGILSKKFKVYYLTIDDIRLWFKYDSIPPDKSKEIKTNIKIYNLTKNYSNVEEILNNANELIIISGINVPGKYLSALPGTISEITQYLKDIKNKTKDKKNKCKIILTGTAASIGTRLEGGKMPEFIDKSFFDVIEYNYLGINDYDKINSIKNADIIDQIPWEIITEIETGRGCDIGKCSFCTEPIKSKVEFRETQNVIDEIKALSNKGVKHFRFGKQTCFYSFRSVDEIEKLLKEVSKLKPETLHIDNVNPNKVISKDGRKITELVVKYCTEGNIAAFGVESFDREVVKKNYLNTIPLVAHKATQILNELGSKRGPNGMPIFLPGINIIFGLMGESKKTHEENMNALKKMYDENLMIRRINIRQVVPFEGTKLYEEAGTKFIKKNKKYYWKWRNDIRQNIDFPMLKKLVPVGLVLKNVRMEIYDGNTTFGRQFGTYPLVIGVKKRLELGKRYNIKVIGHMLRSITGEVVE
jgi:radical SAM superfamily enzyme with C-terminal helix-hairpin-helix motif